jgi:hypothetical protein
MTAGPESECLRRATRYSARGIEAGWPRRCAARYTRARCGTCRSRNIIAVERSSSGRTGWELPKSGECFLHRPSGNWLGDSCFSSLQGGSNRTTSMEAPRLANRQEGSAKDKPEVQAPLAPAVERQGSQAASLACEGETRRPASSALRWNGRQRRLPARHNVRAFH